MMRVAALALAVAGAMSGLDLPLYVFDNGTGRGSLTIAEQAELAKRTGYAGIFYSGTKDIPDLVAQHKARGLKVVGIYTGMNLSDPKPAYDSGLPAAIRDLKGTGALITLFVNGKGTDEVALPIIRDIADMAAASGLKVALYPHYGMHVARIEDALRLIGKAGKSNLGLVFNLCHWLRSGDEANFAVRMKEALPHMMMVSVNGADHEGDWNRLIQPLDRGEYDVAAFVRAWRAAGYKGPFGQQCYNVPGDREENLKRSMAAWRKFR